MKLATKDDKYRILAKITPYVREAKKEINTYQFLNTQAACMQDLCYNFYHPCYSSLTQNKKAVDHHPAKSICQINKIFQLEYPENND